MGNFKGSGITILEKLFAAGGPGLRAQFLASLTPEEAKAYQHVLPATWLPVEMATALSVKAAQALFPNDPQRLRKLGRARGKAQLTGLYRVLFSVLSLETLLTQIAKLWTNLHQEGRAWFERPTGAQEASFFVGDYPGLPADLREIICGWIEGCGELLRIKDFRVDQVPNPQNPRVWEWKVVWR